LFIFIQESFYLPILKLERKRERRGGEGREERDLLLFLMF
jgi:hypothetical protein